jgi:ABC-2 type transport system permease protein
VQFLFVIPDDFSRRVVRGEKPAVLISVDATDPSAASNALAALGQVSANALDRDLIGPLAP